MGLFLKSCIYLFWTVLDLHCHLQAFSSCKWGLLSGCSAWASHCRGFSCCRAWVLGLPDFSSCSIWALECRLRSCGAWASLSPYTWNLSRPGIESVSPALACGFLTSGQPAKSPDRTLGFRRPSDEVWLLTQPPTGYKILVALLCASGLPWVNWGSWWNLLSNIAWGQLRWAGNVLSRELHSSPWLRKQGDYRPIPVGQRNEYPMRLTAYGPTGRDRLPREGCLLRDQPSPSMKSQGEDGRADRDQGCNLH